MKTKEKLHDRVYRSKKNGNVYPVKADGSAIDIDNPLDVFDSKKYCNVGENNHFVIFDLKVTKHK